MSSDAAAAVLARVAATYGACTSYRDEGVVTTTFYAPKRRVERKPFKTRFVRGQGFLFEFRRRRGEDDWDNHTCWLEGDKAREWSFLFSGQEAEGKPRREVEERLSMVLAGATGISGGSAWRIPSLLMPDLREGPPWSEKDAAIVEDAEAARGGCIAVDVSRSRASERLWINESTWLIQRVLQCRHLLQPASPADYGERIKKMGPEAAAALERAAAFMANQPPSEVETLTSYTAAIDAPVAEDEMRYVPGE